MAIRSCLWLCLGLVAGGLASGCVQTNLVRQAQSVEIKTSPAGANVWVGERTGQRSLGTSPVSVDLEYSIAQKTFNSHWWWSLGGGLAAGGAGAGLMTNTPYWNTGITFVTIGGAAVLLAAIICGLGEAQQGDMVEERQVVIGADLSGYRSTIFELQIPSDKPDLNLTLPTLAEALDPGPAPAKSGALGAQPSPASGSAASGQILAVFDVHDVSGKTEHNVLVQLTAYLSTALATSGKYKVIPRHQLRQRLLDQKTESYRECVEEACQIELGKTLSAQKSLATQLLKVGNKCAVTANLYDLKTETSEKGAMVNTGCEPDKLLEAMGKVAEQISGR